MPALLCVLFWPKSSHPPVLIVSFNLALFPKNQIDSVESVIRMCSIDDATKLKEYRDKLMGDFDISRPLMLSSLQRLQKVVTHEKAKKILSLYVANSSSTSDDYNSTSNSNPDLEALVNSMPAGTIPISWVLGNTPAMNPRFFSIVSKIEHIHQFYRILFGDFQILTIDTHIILHFCSKSSIMDSEITITQSAFHFAHSGKAGTTSKWLRLSLMPGDDIEVIFSSTNFHLPQDENAPVISECLVLFCHTYLPQVIAF